MNTIDIFSGLGGFSAGAVMVGCNVLWAANHWSDAVKWHEINHPGTLHLCQDLHQAHWENVPEHDLLLASPCCQGHSRAKGAKTGPHYDASRSTAWAVVSAAEYKRPPVILVENVPEFLEWELYPAWVSAMEALGYSLAPHIVDAADLGAPQNRIRMFLVLTLSKRPLYLKLRTVPHKGADSFIDFDSGKWTKIDKPGRAKATLSRVANGSAQFGERFLMSYYGNTKSGRDLARPIGTITTRDRWAIINGDSMRMLSAGECKAAMSFPEKYRIPDNHTLAIHLMGNAVCPLPASKIIKAIKAAA